MLVKKSWISEKSFVLYLTWAGGNGRTSWLIMNHQLLENGFPAMSIAKETWLEYFNAFGSLCGGGGLKSVCWDDCRFGRQTAGLLPENETACPENGSEAKYVNLQKEEMRRTQIVSGVFLCLNFSRCLFDFVLPSFMEFYTEQGEKATDPRKKWPEIVTFTYAMVHLQLYEISNVHLQFQLTLAFIWE